MSQTFIERLRSRTPAEGSRRGCLLSEECLLALRAFNQTRADNSLAAYVEAAKRTVLDHYGIRLAFQPTADPLQQDILSTWLEYLVYKHWLSTYCKTRVETYQRQYDKAWEKLLVLDVLTPAERETRQIDGNALQMARRKTEAGLESRARDCEAALLSFETADEQHEQHEQHEQRSPSARLQLAESKMKHDRANAPISAIEDFLCQTVDYRLHGPHWEMLADTHYSELPWVLRQLPQVQRDARQRMHRVMEGQGLLRRSLRIANQKLESTVDSQAPPPPALWPKKRGRAEADKSLQAPQQLQESVKEQRQEGARKRRRVAKMSLEHQ
ncbi:hypothetical protein M406DRAFT_326815 [Cryphonectria parasitica EP155]|uniref:Uncharacterized protein n=1 Tax=Cryphonectria parasitica (strain ATCC 38755 / EP155) TaxID=660469 RepID=A0A9P4Y767_CRYP1|nr:uncharacterized protein M406DRAFT_326815 [Cryphonectria parasitica EP155]KAF3768219.1 hypothetical protein M406DRAFT_326815 [Cryphonectria parasitica EP155]